MSEVEKVCPCKSCQDRNATCHGKCKRYRLWRSRHQHVARESRRKFNQFVYKNDLNGYRK